MPVVVAVQERGTRVRPSAPLLLVRAESKPISHRLLPESPGVSGPLWRSGLSDWVNWSLEGPSLGSIPSVATFGGF